MRRVLQATILAAVVLVGMGTTTVQAHGAVRALPTLPHAAASAGAVTAVATETLNVVYTVRAGDTLWRIGAHYNIGWQPINDANRAQIANPDLIYPGQRFTIPRAGIRTAPSPVARASSGAIARGEPCTASRTIAWTIRPSSWAIPPSCFGGIYRVNPYSYGVETADYGWCSWWPRAIKHDNAALVGTRYRTPRVGAVVAFAPGDQGASSEGHFGYVESIGPSGWILISEMNMYWRGGGWQKVNYRYVHVDWGTSFIY